MNLENNPRDIKSKRSIFQKISNVIIIFAAILSLFFSVTNGNSMWVITVLFAIFYISFFGVFKVKLNWSSAIIILISSIRYSLLPLLYTSGLRSTYVSYLSYEFKHLTTVIVVMCFEMTGIFTGIYLGSKSGHKAFQKMADNFVRKPPKCIERGIATNIFILVGVILVVIFPNIIRGIGVAADKNAVAGSVEAVFQVCIIMLTIFFLYKTEKIKICEVFKVFSVIIGFVILIYLSSNMATSTSRNILIINTVILLIYLERYHVNYLKFLVPIIGVVSLFFFSLLSYNRFQSYQLSSNVIASVFNSMFGYQTLNAYFAGPTNIEVGIVMLQNYGNVLGPLQLIIDVLANIPLLNKLVYADNTIVLFNRTMSGGIANDQIVPITIQSIAYFSYICTPLIVFITAYYSQKYYFKAKNAGSIIYLYSYSYITVVLSMAAILSVNSISMLIVMRVLPVLFLGRLNKLLLIRRR